ncbi:MAG TPA: DUF5615 family PIN-like protein [Acidimicrobiales bacterium]|nr:DUF5615 family PIN-like protein [Acidimicrobiales bacterium]
MKFLVDAQLPAKLAQLLRTAGHDVVHTSELPDGNRTTDQALARQADGEGRVVVTKDRDFRDGYLLNRSPRHLLVVATGNIANRDLLTLFDGNLTVIIEALAESPYVELRPAGLILHAEPD